MKKLTEGTGGALVLITCEDCNCRYEASRPSDIRYWKQGQEWPMYECPVCHRTAVDWDLAKKIFEGNAEVAIADSTAEARKRANRWWNKLRNKEGKN